MPRLLRCFLAASLALLLAAAPALAQRVVYVKQDAAGAGDGTSWHDAYRELRTALPNAVAGDELWVVRATYKPTPWTYRNATFQLKSGVAVYGGFVGTETQRDERDWVLNETILSGNIGTQGDSLDNSYHVVTASGVDSTAVLDGFTIRHGTANGTGGPSDPLRRGGGLYSVGGAPSSGTASSTPTAPRSRVRACSTAAAANRGWRGATSGATSGAGRCTTSRAAPSSRTASSRATWEVEGAPSATRRAARTWSGWCSVTIPPAVAGRWGMPTAPTPSASAARSSGTRATPAGPSPSARPTPSSSTRRSSATARSTPSAAPSPPTAARSSGSTTSCSRGTGRGRRAAPSTPRSPGSRRPGSPPAGTGPARRGSTRGPCFTP